MKQLTGSEEPIVEVWGMAAGRGSTSEAARGALCIRDYPADQPIPESDWLEIIAKRSKP